MSNCWTKTVFCRSRTSLVVCFVENQSNLNRIMSIESNISQNLVPACRLLNTNCGDFGSEEIVDIAFLGFCAIVGSFGNLLVIFSLLNEKKVHKQANVFIVSLAAADLFVSKYNCCTFNDICAQKSEYFFEC